MEERECPYNWWEYKLAQPLWKTKKRITIWSSNPTPRHIPDKTPIQKDTCTPVLTAALFTIVKTWKQPKCPLTDEWTGFPDGSLGKESACNAGDRGDVGLIPGSERFPRGRHGKPLQYSCLENPMDRGAWQSTIHRVTNSQTLLK